MPSRIQQLFNKSEATAQFKRDRCSLHNGIHAPHQRNIHLLNTCKDTAYSTELKTLAAKDYLTGGGSHMQICKNMELDQLGRCATGFEI